MHIPIPEQFAPTKTTYHKNQTNSSLLKDQVVLIAMINHIVAACVTNDLKVEIRAVGESTFSYSVRKEDHSSIATGEFGPTTNIDDLIDLICGRVTSHAQPPAMKVVDGREVSYWRLVMVRQEDSLSHSNIEDNEYWVGYDEKGTECFRQLVGEKNDGVEDVAAVQFINLGERGTCVFLAFKSDIEKARKEKGPKGLRGDEEEAPAIIDVECRSVGPTPSVDNDDH